MSFIPYFHYFSLMGINKIVYGLYCFNLGFSFNNAVFYCDGEKNVAAFNV